MSATTASSRPASLLGLPEALLLVLAERLWLMAESPVPMATARAIRIATTHPAVRDVRVVGRPEDGSTWVELDMEQQLPSMWRAAGVSPSGVRTIETVAIWFPSDFPQGPPRAHLREDFDRSHPHLLPVPKSAGLPPQPCVVEVNPAELIQARGFSGYLDQLADWLDKAAMVELNSPRHGWEPVRRDHIDDELILDPDQIRRLAAPDGECYVVRTHYLRFVSASGAVAMQVALYAEEKVDPAKAGCGEEELTDRVHRGRGAALVVSAPNRDGVPFVVDVPVPENVATVDDLIRRAELFGCRAALEAKLAHVAMLLASGKFGAGPLPVVLLVRRPFNLIGSQSSIEICPYLLDLRPNEDLLMGRGDVRLCGVRDDVSVPLLRRASGYDAEVPRKRWALLGCGSVGSKIAIHLAKTGMGPSEVCDRAVMSPHNYARHALLPEPGVRGGVPGYKAVALAHALSGFRQEPAAQACGAEELWDTPESRAELAGC